MTFHALTGRAHSAIRTLQQSVGSWDAYCVLQTRCQCSWLQVTCPQALTGTAWLALAP